MARGKHAAGKTRTHTPGLRIPPRDNEAADAALDSYRIQAPKVDDFTTEDEAEAYKARIRAAVNWLNRHEVENPSTGARYDLRIRPKIYECWQVDGDAVYRAHEINPDVIAEWEEDGHKVVHFWRVDYWAQAPQDKGFRKRPDVLREAVTNSMRSQGHALPDTDRMPAKPEQPKEPVPPPRRTVLYKRAGLRPGLAAPTWSVITADEAPGRDVRGLRRFCGVK